MRKGFTANRASASLHPGKDEENGMEPFSVWSLQELCVH